MAAVRTTPATRREWSFLAAGAFLAALGLALLVGRYEVVAAGANGLAYRLDRLTGDVRACTPSGCEAPQIATADATGGFTAAKP